VARIDAVRSSLAVAAGRPPAAIDFRAAASVAQLGLCARLIAPALGAAALGHPLSIDMMSTRWVPGLGGPFRLSLPDTAFTAPSWQDSPASAPDVLAPLLRLLDGPIRSLVGLTASLGVSRRLLWGNVSSAINGAAVMLTAARPGFARESAAISSGVLRFPELISSYRGQPVISFRRQTCCLIYRVAKDAPEYCGDCILRMRIRPQPATSTRRQMPTG
jgi:FhuF 2Fe-2S C-terminal domain